MAAPLSGRALPPYSPPRGATCRTCPIWQLAQLEALRDLSLARGRWHEVERMVARISNSRDASRRAQAVSRTIRYSTRLPKGTWREASTGQMRTPPRIAAAVNPLTGIYHAFAVYELRSGDAARGSRFHVYVTDTLPCPPSWPPRGPPLL